MREFGQGSEPLQRRGGWPAGKNMTLLFGLGRRHQRDMRQTRQNSRIPVGWRTSWSHGAALCIGGVRAAPLNHCGLARRPRPWSELGVSKSLNVSAAYRLT
ncbi:hypothetical protein GGTG_12222 [Gaeumannomyces tritici R3-111a-1]|uniref:Uncharacterized protein n=1 Tax=Gaeumannomyces tritici (strain R3-111a-1) TaxID=644352 RepID=J3PFE5_GAET3|nr:hypothetical protein GGTG_12222 [Gaeumannomyces tritici R3-111a-1]EJT70047.1 hypothetical protein GGTG_12222 [Gaeumannomyces tritici R3-111a-1]